MPEVGKIQSTNFQALLTELGITRSDIPFALRSEVTPVVLVGGQVTVESSPTPAYRIQDVFTVGIVVAPAIGTILADTGPLPVGIYGVLVDLFHEEAAGVRANFTFEWRNAANAVNQVSQRWGTLAEGIHTFTIRLQIENADERFRVIAQTAGAVGVPYKVTIFSRT